MNPGVAAKSPGNQRQQEHAEKNPQLGTQEFEVNQHAPGDGRGEQERHFGLGEGQRRAFMRNNPGQQHDDEKHERAEQFKQQQMFRRKGQVCPRLPAILKPPNR